MSTLSSWKSAVPPRLKAPVKRRLAALRRRRVWFGTLRRTEPVSRSFGYDRGLPVDRYYIERFLDRHRADIRGRTLEIGDATYTRRFGGQQVTTADVLHVHAANPEATFVGDLANGDFLPSDTFDCIVLTQTLHLIYDLRSAVATVHRILRPGGIVLVTVPGISQISPPEDEWCDEWQWSLMPGSARRLFAEVFGSAVEIESRGNVLAATAFLQGVASHELRRSELDVEDPQYPMLVTVRAVKALEPVDANADAADVEAATGGTR